MKANCYFDMGFNVRRVRDNSGKYRKALYCRFCDAFAGYEAVATVPRAKVVKRTKETVATVPMAVQLSLFG